VGERPDENSDFSVCAILVHVPTQTEIERVRLQKHEDGYLEDFPLSIMAGWQTIAMEAQSSGILMTGASIREADGVTKGTGSGAAEKPAKKKKKRMKGHAKGRQKDGFARGMSLRG